MLNPIYAEGFRVGRGLRLQPFNDLKNQEETKTDINPWMGEGEVVVARNRIVKNEDGTEKVDNSVPFLKPSGILIFGKGNPEERTIKIAKSFGIPFVRIEEEAYPLKLQEKAEPELTYDAEKAGYEKVTSYLSKNEETENQLGKADTDISVDSLDTER